MSHFAEIDADNKVIRVLVGDNSMLNEGYDWLIHNLGGTWIQTSYNATIRGKFAGIGDSYNVDEDIFISPQPFSSWLRIGSFWTSPIPYPTDGKIYEWNENDLRWDVVNLS
jgi:hypothetical protein